MASEAPIHWLVVGNTDNRRLRLFAEALEACGQPAPHTMPLLDAILAPERLAERIAALPRPLVVRLDSPGESFDVTRELVALGAEEAATVGTHVLPAVEARALEPDRGLILYPRQWYLGYRGVLEAWGRILDAEAGEGVTVMNHPDAIAVMFDKPAGQARLAEAGVPIPERLLGVTGYASLREAMAARGIDRAFVKLANGSSASGVVAYSDRRLESALTSMERVADEAGVRYYNSLRLSRYRSPEIIAEIIDFLCADGAQVEAWVPKARLQGAPFDIRVVVIDGVPQHYVARLGRTPLTNLHLGNKRGDSDALHALLGPERWGAMMETCARVAEVFPTATYFGLDLAVAEGLDHHVIIEVNAFGDLIPNITFEGRSTHEAEVVAMIERVRRGA